MIIESIKLKNYRQFKDEEILFSQNKKNENFTIIQGANGSGKSNLFNSINWCLYGKEVHLTKEGKTLPLLNTISLKEKSVEDLEVEVEIKMRDNKNRVIIISRKQKFFEDSEGKIKSMPSEQEIIRNLNNNMIRVTDTVYILDKLIPESIREYFFFDGERLDDYFKKEGAESIKKSVFKISQIDLLKKSIDHLDEKRRDFLKENKNLTPLAEKIRNEIESFSKALNENEENLEKKEESFKDARIILKEILDKIKKNPVPNAKELKKQRFEFEKEENEARKEVKDLDLNFEEYLLEIWPKVLLHEAIKSVKDTILDLKKKDKFPPGIDGDFLKELLKSKECICGRKISDRDDSQKKLERILEIYDKLSNVGNNLSEVKTNIEIMLREIPSFKDKYLEYEKRKKEFEKKREKASKDLRKIIDNLSKTDESFANFEEQFEQINREKDNTLEEIGRLKLSIESSKSAIKKRHEDLENELKKETKFNILRKKLNFCQEALEKCENIKKEIMEETKKNIEEKTKKQFFDLIWNPKNFKDITIDENYNLSVIHSSGLESIGSLSAGQRQILALSFISALSSISGFDLPIIIDTPLGRISKQTRLNIVEKLPFFLKDKQVTLLVTDEEYTPEVRRKLAKNVGKEYEIKLTEYARGGIAKIIKK